MRTVAEIEAELRQVKDTIDAAYWAFTRQARGRLASAEVYRRRASLEAELRTARKNHALS